MHPCAHTRNIENCKPHQRVGSSAAHISIPTMSLMALSNSNAKSVAILENVLMSFDQKILMGNGNEVRRVIVKARWHHFIVTKKTSKLIEYFLKEI